MEERGKKLNATKVCEVRSLRNSQKYAIKIKLRGGEVSSVSFTAQCVDSFRQLSQHDYAMWPPGNYNGLSD